MFHVARAGCRLGYRVEGSLAGDVLMFSNSLGTTCELWDRQVAALSPSLGIIRYDTRGHGASDAPAGPYSVEMLGLDALAILDAAGVRRAHVCGLSLGGLTAMWLGVHAPDRVASLILSSTAARIMNAMFWEERILSVRASGLGPLADASMERWFTAPYRQAYGDVVARFRDTLVGCDREGYAGCCAALRDGDLRESVGAIRRPVLAIAGRQDPVTPPADAEDICARIPGARLALLDAAHLANVEQAEAYTRLLTTFIGESARERMQHGPVTRR